MVKTQLRGVRIEGDTPLNASPGQPQICLDFLLGKRIKRLLFLQKVYNLFVGWNIRNLLQLLLIEKIILFYLCSKFMSFCYLREYRDDNIHE